MIKNIYNLGDAALYCDFGDTVNKETNLEVINYGEAWLSASAETARHDVSDASSSTFFITSPLD
jgi:hypothetical protein